MKTISRVRSPSFYPVTVKRPVPSRQVVVVKKTQRNANELLKGMAESSYWVGKEIVLFTIFYCTLQWNYYRSLRKKNEDKKKDD